jgi:hypothetical protein
MQSTQEEKESYFVSKFVFRPPSLLATISHFSFILNDFKGDKCAISKSKKVVESEKSKNKIEKLKPQNHIEHL